MDPVAMNKLLAVEVPGESPGDKKLPLWNVVAET